MVSGYKNLRTIENQIADLSEEEQRLRKELERLNASHAELLDQRGACYRQLAEVRIEDALADGVIDQADQLHSRVSGILRARQQTIEELTSREAQALEQRAALVANAERVRDEVVQLEKQLDKAAEKAEVALQDSAAFKDLLSEQSSLKNTFDEADAKTKRAEENRKRKGEAYESDPLFMYLWNRQYGSADYDVNFLIEWADGKVADLVGYHDARANYALLREIPVRLRAHCDQLLERVAAGEKSVEQVRAKKIEEIAGKALLADLDRVRGEQAENIDALEQIDGELSELSGQLRHYAGGLDESFREAASLAAQFLEQDSLERLRALARQTVEPTDDQLLVRIEQIDNEASQVKREVSELRNDLKQISKRREELVEVSSRVRRHHYDDPGSQYEPDDFIEDLLQEVLKGAINGYDYWQRSQRRHRWSGRPADPFRRGSGLPPFGRRRSRQSKDFRTGGGF